MMNNTVDKQSKSNKYSKSNLNNFVYSHHEEEGKLKIIIIAPDGVHKAIDGKIIKSQRE